MLGIGTLVAIACLKQPMPFQNPGTMWRDKLCVLFKKIKREKNSVPLCVRISLFPLRFTKPPRPLSAACVRKYFSVPTEFRPRYYGNLPPH